MNTTIEKFGFPDTQLIEWEQWIVLLRPAQPTIGSMVLAAKSEATAFGDLPAAAHAELKRATQAIEGVLARLLAPERLNYLMLMMVDPHVHFHVLPRYPGTRVLAGIAVEDAGWPGAPDLSAAHTLAAVERERLATMFRDAFAQAE